MEKTGNPILNHIRKKIYEQDRNFILIICGPTGSGKSSSSLCFAEAFDPNFSIDRVAFTAKDFMGLLNSKKTKKGACIVWEETGVSINSRDFHTITNQVISKSFQTFRDQNLLIIINVPFYESIDKQVRQLIHAYFATGSNSINSQNKTVTGRFRFIDINPINGKEYKKMPRVLVNGKKFKCPSVSFGLPSSELWREYRKRAKKYKKKIRLDGETAVARVAIQKEKNECLLTNKEIEKQVWKNRKAFTNSRGTINLSLLMGMYNIGRWRAKKIKSVIELKMRTT